MEKEKLEAIKELKEEAGISDDKFLNSFIWDEEDLVLKKVFPMGEHQDFFYFGVLLPKEEEVKDKEGKPTGDMKQTTRPCLITSEKKIIQITNKTKFNLKIDFENIPYYLPHRWELPRIKSFLSSKEVVDGSKLLNDISTQAYEKYMFIREPVWYKVLALWDIGTYFYQLFEAYPFIENRGIAGTGKTKSMSISSMLAFNGGQVMANPSEATLFRETDEVRGTKYFDEAEKLFVYNKATKQYEGDTRVELINASYTREAKVPRQEKIGGRFVTKWYSPYSPTQLSSINGLYGATETRAITRICTKSPNEDKRGELEPTEDRKKPFWAETRDKCYRFALQNWDEIKELYLNFPKDCGLKRRDLQIWKPILTLAKKINEKVYCEVLDFAIKISERRLDDLVPESSFDYMCLEALRETIISTNNDKVYVEAIKRNYCALRDDEEGLKNIYLNRNISNHLDKLGFKELRNRDKKASYFAVDETTFNEIVTPISPQLAIISTSSPSSTPTHVKEEEKGGDSVVIGGDKKNEGVVMVAIDGENVDGKRIKSFSKEDFEKAGLSEEYKKIIVEEEKI